MYVYVHTHVCVLFLYMLDIVFAKSVYMLDIVFAKSAFYHWALAPHPLIIEYFIIVNIWNFLIESQNERL